MKYPLLILLTLVSISCNTTDPPIPGSLSIKLEQISCTEAWLRITTDVQLPVNCTLKGNGNSKYFVLSNNDTVVCIDSLLVNKSLSFKAELNDLKLSSPEVTGTTKDTTSHNFTSQAWVFGEFASSVLYDVAIINKNDIWAVGEIYLKDSLGHIDPNAYNAIHWDGVTWELKRIYFYGQCSSVDYPPLLSILIFGKDSMLVTNGSGIGFFNGDSITSLDCSLLPLLQGPVNKIWGISSKDFYIVGNKGSIAHYQNGHWIKIESGTTANIHDIWSDGEKVLCAASNSFDNFDFDIISLDAKNRASNFNWLNDRRVYSAWFIDNKLFACGDGMFIMSNGKDWIKQSLTPSFKVKVRGNSLSNVFLVGDFGLIAHYNGATWKEYPEFSSALVYNSVDVTENLMVTVGFIQTGILTQAVVQILRR